MIEYLLKISIYAFLVNNKNLVQYCTADSESRIVEFGRDTILLCQYFCIVDLEVVGVKHYYTKFSILQLCNKWVLLIKVLT